MPVRRVSNRAVVSLETKYQIARELANTDDSFGEIAKRFQVSVSTVANVNRTFNENGERIEDE